MTRDVGSELFERISRGEGVTIDFKRSLDQGHRPGVVRIRNAGGGAVLVGVSDAGKIVGVADHNRLKSRVRSTARSADPPIDVEIDSVGEILRVVVPPQKRKPYSFGGRFFMRDGASRCRLRRWRSCSTRPDALHFDRKPCADFSIENDLDEET